MGVFDPRLVLIAYILVTTLLFLGNWLVLLGGWILSLGLWGRFKLTSREFWLFLGGVKFLLIFLLALSLITSMIKLTTQYLELRDLNELSWNGIGINQLLVPARILISMSLLFGLKPLLPLSTLRDCVGWFVGLISKTYAGPISILILLVFATLGQLLHFSQQRTEALQIRGILVKRTPLLWIRLQATGILSEAASVSQNLSEGVYLRNKDNKLFNPPQYSFPSLTLRVRLIQVTMVIGLMILFLGFLWVEEMLG